MKQNLHTHPVYCDGNDTPEEMVQTAIAKKFDILGFSGHGHVDYDDYAMSLEDTEKYIREVNALKEKYRDQIQIHLGTEVDVLYRIPDNTDRPSRLHSGLLHTDPGSLRLQYSQLRISG